MAGAGFGEHLRREREMRGVSLEEIAGATRISTRFLDALEKEAWDRLPGGVFNRGFVRTVARFLGLEEESLLAEYSLAAGEASPAPPVPAELPVPQPSASRRKAAWLAIAAVPVALALAAGGWFGWQWIAARQAELNAAASSLPAPPTPPPVPLPGPPEESEQDPAASPQQPYAPLSPWSQPPGALQLKIEAARDTALSITADGHLVFSGPIEAGETRSFSANTALAVEAQDAGAIRLELNGQALEPLGPHGQPGRITLGRPSAPADAGGHD